jgi:hypothetical protein
MKLKWNTKKMCIQKKAGRGSRNIENTGIIAKK